LTQKSPVQQRGFFYALIIQKDYDTIVMDFCNLPEALFFKKYSKPAKMKDSELKEKLDYQYHRFERLAGESDPVWFAHRYEDARDREFIAFVSSVFTYGNIKAILSFLEALFAPLGSSPLNTLENMNESQIRELTKEFRYRYYKPDDIASFLLTMRTIYNRYGSLERLFIMNYRPGADAIKTALQSFSFELAKEIEHQRGYMTGGTGYFFPLPEKKSACKRFNLFLRWMARKDNIDLGLWSKVDKADLIIPLDIHIARQSRALGLTTRKTADWNMAEEITGRLRRFDSADPVKYDFALCHIGIRNEEL
jgi:uncharacterized protein (TIGR02757 family)